MSTPRGVQLNNPLNIRMTGVVWVGLSEDQPDAAFCKFKSPEYGFRAAFKNLRAYQVQHAIRTIRGVIDRWAPPDENDTEAYITAVCRRAVRHPDDQVDLTSWVDVSVIVHAMTIQEQGSFEDFFTIEQMRDGAMLAGVSGVPDHEH